ncbi:hypothetical protein SISNIDRAFT_498756, partial [Sistotremastrum niveocremeum HHB9708]
MQRSPITCYGCGKTGHGVSTCPSMQELVDNNTLIRNERGIYTFPNGVAVRRQADENMVSAVSRMLAEETGLADVGIITAVPGTATTSDESTSILATGVVEPPKKKTRFEGVEILKNPMHPNRYPPEAMTDDDVIMEDPAITAAKKRKNPPTPSTSTPRPTRTDEATTQSRSALQSEVQRQTNPTE